MPSDAGFRLTNAIHRRTLALTRGKVGWKLRGMPVVELTTTGRKSGLKRTVMLTSPYQEGETYVVVASRSGDDKPPAWLGNVQADGNVEVARDGGAPEPWTARVATPEERARLWPALTEKHGHYAAYQRRTDREIPLVLLTPGR